MSARLADTIAAELASADKDSLLRPRKPLHPSVLPCVAVLIASVYAFGPDKVLSVIVLAALALLAVVGLLWTAEEAQDARRSR